MVNAESNRHTSTSWPFAGAVAMPQRGQGADRCVQRGIAIHQRRRGAQRLPHRLPRQRHQSAHRLAERIERGPIGIGPVLTEAGNRHQDDAGIQPTQRFIIEAHGLHRARPEILQHDVGCLHQGGEDLLAARVAQIETNAALAAVIDAEIHALAAHHGRVLAGLFATETLDLDHLGAEVRQNHAATRPRLVTRQFEHANAVETETHGFPRPLCRCLRARQTQRYGAVGGGVKARATTPLTRRGIGQ